MSTVQTVAGILLVFALLALFYWVANRYSGGRGFSRRNSKIEILETRGIGDKRALLLVRVGSGTFLVGSTTHQISLLSAIEAAGAPETAQAAIGSGAEGALDETDSEVADPTPGEPGAPSPRLLPQPSFRSLLEMFR